MAREKTPLRERPERYELPPLLHDLKSISPRRGKEADELRRLIYAKLQDTMFVLKHATENLGMAWNDPDGEVLEELYRGWGHLSAAFGALDV